MSTENDTDRKLDVLIATHGDDGLRRVAEMTLPAVSGVKYIVTWQTIRGGAVPVALKRDDIEIHKIPDIGLSNNRNAGIALSKSTYCLIADNDLKYSVQGLKAIIDKLDNNPEVDIATFRYSGDYNFYPSVETDFTEYVPSGYNTVSIEIAFRVKSIGNIRFDTNFGIGGKLTACEDGVFILDCRRAGLKCRFFPVTIVEHTGLSTGYRPIDNPHIAMAEGAYIRLAYGINGYLRVPLFAWRAWRKGRMPLFWGVYHVTRGFFSKYVGMHKAKARAYRTKQ